jgi:hypothetical protein
MPQDEFTNHDELMQQMELDEMEGATKLSPRDYGKLRGISPQLVYYHIRQGKLKKETCLCGRSVIDVDAADAFFKKGRHTDGEDGEPVAQAEGDEAGA